MTASTPTTPARPGHRWDAIVVGAGPSGAMAARELARVGAEVLLVERRDFPREKVCGGCLNGHAMGVLESAGLGALARRSGGVELGSFRLGVRGRTFRLDLPAGLAVPRGPFDAALVGAAVEAGVGFLPRTEALVGPVAGDIRRVKLGPGRGDPTVEARVVLVAAGLGLPGVIDGPGPRVRVARGSRLGVGCLLEGDIGGYEAGVIHMAVGAFGYVGAVRLADGRLHIAAAIRPGALHQPGGPGAAAGAILDEAGFGAIPGLRSTRWLGTTSLTRRARPIADARLFLLGDAAGYVEPFTGEGIAWALASGRAVAPIAIRAIERWEPGLADEWGRTYGRVVRRRQLACRAAALAMRRPLVARAAFEAMDRLPGLARRLLDHLNAPPRLLEAT